MSDVVTVVGPKVETQTIGTPENTPSTPVLSGTPAENIRWRVHYEDTEGKLLEKSPYTPRNPELVPEPEQEDDAESLQPSVFDIVIHVTIRDVIETKSITTKAAATKAGKDQNHAGKEQDGEMGAIHGETGMYKIKSVNYEEMVIRSPHLVKALQTVVKYYPKQEIAGDTITVAEPYHFLLHHEKLLAEYFNSNTHNVHDRDAEIGLEGEGAVDNSGQEHFKILQAFLNARWEKKIQQEKTRHAQTPPVATYEMLWMLFKPGTRVFADDPWGEPAGYIVRSLEDNDGELAVNLWCLEFDGEYLDRRPITRYISSYEGAREITSLHVYPMQLDAGGTTHPLNQSLREKLEARGEKSWNCIEKILRCKYLQAKYNGRLLDSSTQYKGKVIIDPESFYNESDGYSRPDFVDDGDMEPTSDCYWTDPPDSDHAPRGQWASYQNITADNIKANKKNHTLDKDHFFLISRRLAGFLLKSRKWHYIDVNYVIEYTPDPDIVESLQIPQDTLNMIAALVHRFENKDETWATDFIQSKGEGRIFLLHGPSGVGKTYTAECIAEFTGRPLLSLTCADIGTDEREMEDLLATWFNLSENWGAILLIDEADVYFERRAIGQLQRNSLVSAFLRSMEYYRGILFLTTNRLGHMDDAILSRVHLIIEYSDLVDQTRLKVWDQMIKKLRKEREDFDVDPYFVSYLENDPEILELQWNGREIRNAFQTAVSLAVHEAKTATPPKEKVILRKGHLKTVAIMSKAFQEYMKNFKGDAAKRALLDGARMDDSMREAGIERKRVLDELRKGARTRRT